VRRAEIDRARRKRPESLNAYDLYLRALPHAYANTPAETDKALKLLNRCLELDPAFASAHGYAAWCREQRYFRNGFHPEDRVAALAHAEAALGIFSSDPQAISMAAFVRANLTRDYEGAIADLDRALAMNENSALALGFSALAAAHSERHERAIDHARRALRLSPLDDPLNYHPYCALAVTHLFTQQYAEAVRYSMLTIRMNPVFSVPHAYLVASYIGLGNVSAARGAAQRLLEVAPAFTIEGFVRMDLFRAQLMKRLAASLEAAGLPLRHGP
jgi:tetratricopeptide (TPR) repeat protein